MPVLQRRVSGSGSSTSFPLGPLHVTTLAEAMQEFIVRYGGEWRVLPMEPLKSPATTEVKMGNVPPFAQDFALAPRPRIAGFYPEEGLWGNNNSGNGHLVFEYGTGRSNVASYSFSVDRQQVGNYVRVPRVGFPEPGRTGTTAHAVALDADSITAMAMRYDAWVDPGEIELATQRQDLANAHRNLRAGPRRIINFTPVVNAELQPWEDYNVGDFVRFRALNGATLRFDVIVRIYSITASLDAQGNESVTVSTSQEATP
jgi:hypothetical protein